jgi:hypothetical protein
VNVRVPLVVTGDPLTVKMDGADKPTLVTEPPALKLVIVIDPVLPLTLIPDPAVIAVTPSLLMVMAPVDEVTLIPVPAVALVTPVLVSVNVPPNATGLPLTLSPVLPLTVMLEF